MDKRPYRIDDWVASVRSLCELKWKIQTSKGEPLGHNRKRKKDQWTSLKKKKYTISPSVKDNLEEWPSSERRHGDERKSELESRENWEDMIKDIQDRAKIWGLPPKVEVDGDDIDMVDPKAAVIEMVRKANDGDVSLQ